MMNSFIPWVGGKKQLRKEIIKGFPQKLDRYIELFGGAGWVLFGSDRHARMEVYNDANSHLVNLFRMVKYHPEELQREIQSLSITSRELFACWKEQYKVGFYTEIQRAAFFYLLVRASFGSNLSAFASGTTPGNLYEMTSQFEQVQKRLKRVLIEHGDFEKVIAAYDRVDALFYCDPPYHQTEKEYSVTFTQADHIRLRDALSRIKGRFILSYNDDTFVRNLYKDFDIIETARNNNRAHNGTSFKELIIKNYESISNHKDEILYATD